MSSSDLKHVLRKFEFPQCAREALARTEQLLTGRSAPSSKQVDVAMEIISEFIFSETERRSSRRATGLSPLQELQLIDVICDYLSGNLNEIAKNTIFLSLFGGTDSQRRMKVLCTLASMAVSASNTPMLLAVGTWLQQTGCSSPLSLQLAESLIRDHFLLQSSNRAAMNSLANSAPQFVANFMAAVTELYLHEGKGSMKLPPKNLLEVITTWVYTNPNLCMSAQLTSTTLPSGAIPMAAVTPLAGLIHWCALAPFYIDEDVEIEEVSKIPVKRIKLEGEKEDPIKSCKGGTLSESELYKKLHLGVLNSLRAGRRTHGPPTAVNAQHLAVLVPSVQSHAQRLLEHNVQLKVHPQLQDCLDRIGQATQIALANGCVYGNISSLLANLSTLPENRLLRIVIIKAHQQAI